MASVFVTCTAEQTGIHEGPDVGPLNVFRMLASQDSIAKHSLVSDPELADLILFAEWHNEDAICGPYFDRIRRSPLFRRYRQKCVVISGNDRIVPVIPGIFASIPKGAWWRPIARSGPYLDALNTFLRYEPLPESGSGVEWLASFMGGSNTVEARRRLLEVRDPRFCIRDTHNPFVNAAQNNRVDELEKFKREFVNLSLSSRFMLCPRGHGPSSFRLFEAMQMGRAPVIIADDWAEPDGIDWNSCSIRVREQDIGLLPKILEKRAPDAFKMGQAARAAWENNFGPTTLFHYFVEQGLAIVAAGPVARSGALAIARLHLAKPKHARRNWRYFKRQLRNKRKYSPPGAMPE